MISAAQDARWSPFRWRLTIAAFVLLQFGLAALLGTKKFEPPRLPNHLTRIRMLPGTAEERRLATFLAVADPTLFALPAPYGFSGSAWLHRPSFDYRLTNWTEDPQWLDLELTSLAESVRLDAGGVPTSAELAHERYEPPLTQPELLGPKPVYRSELRLEGDLGLRTLDAQPSLPVQRLADVLESTVIQAGVDQEGLVISASIWKGSGSKEADAEALRISKELLFKPIPPPDRRGPSGTLTWGRFVFRWFVIEPPAK